MRPLVKICGITNPEDALFAAGLNVWALGFVFAKSPRKVSASEVKAIVKKLPPYVARVGVFVNDNTANIKKIVESCSLDMVQLHGDESPEFCRGIKNFTKVIKAFRVIDKESLKGFANYEADLYLLDAYSEEVYGGTGRTFNWEVVATAKGYGKNIILAGGLTPENITEAVRIAQPYAVDISSGVEKEPGKKDKKLLKELISKINEL